MGVPSPAGGMGGLGSCLPAALRRRLSQSWHRPAGAARVGLTPRFESVQEAAYQRSCCLCRFLSLLLPHPACRPHTYRPHRRSSAPPLGRLQPQPCSPPANPCPAPAGAALPPPKSWGVSVGTSGRAGGMFSVLSVTGRGQCSASPRGMEGQVRPGHGAGATGRRVEVGCFTWCSGAALGTPDPTCPTGSQDESSCPCHPSCIPLSRLCTSHSPSHCRVSQGSAPPTLNAQPCTPPLCTRDHHLAPWGKTCGLPIPSRTGKGAYLGRKVPGGSGSGRTGLPLGHCTSFLPMAAAACHSPATLPVCYCPGSVQSHCMLPSFSAPTPLRCSSSCCVPTSHHGPLIPNTFFPWLLHWLFPAALGSPPPWATSSPDH